MKIQQMPNRTWLQQAMALEALFGQQIFNHRPQFDEQPLIYRQNEPFLGAMQYPVRDQSANGLFEDMLLPARSDFHAAGDCRGVFHETVV